MKSKVTILCSYKYNLKPQDVCNAIQNCSIHQIKIIIINIRACPEHYESCSNDVWETD